MRKTKIICTLGPSTDKEGVLRELVASGMNVSFLQLDLMFMRKKMTRFTRIFQAQFCKAPQWQDFYHSQMSW